MATRAAPPLRSRAQRRRDARMKRQDLREMIERKRFSKQVRITEEKSNPFSFSSFLHYYIVLVTMALFIAD